MLPSYWKRRSSSTSTTVKRVLAVLSAKAPAKKSTAHLIPNPKGANFHCVDLSASSCGHLSKKGSGGVRGLAAAGDCVSALLEQGRAAMEWDGVETASTFTGFNYSSNSLRVRQFSFPPHFSPKQIRQWPRVCARPPLRYVDNGLKTERQPKRKIKKPFRKKAAQKAGRWRRDMETASRLEELRR
ncbi:hypothetical protein FA13DRAFT_1705452 [Coprinellus micaceus]|uniref:Uncharacterized protein n=1 Tax=Coprinellus micaceus TaxID=71717 RepID=A0A4Y7TT40_COPMI|nr:hypothetical protein FA13DRAFT_1705452 [Coprinellus micaceus]